MTIANQIVIESVEGKEKQLKEALNDLVASSLPEKGCQKFEFYQLYNRATSFFIIEIWKSEKRYNGHLESASYVKQMSIINPLIASTQTHNLKLTQCLTKLGLKEEKK